MLRRAVAEGMRRLNLAANDANALVDRRIVVQLLLAFLERGHNAQVLSVMARMLGLTGLPHDQPLDLEAIHILAVCDQTWG